MYELYQPIIYNEYIKELRKNKGLSIKQLSQQIPFSSGSLSLFENSSNILKNDKLSYILNYYGYDKSFLENFDKEISQLFSDFIKDIIYIDEQSLKISYSKLKKFLAPFEDSILYSAFYLVDFIYRRFNDDDNLIISIDDLLKKQKYLSLKHQGLLNSYCGAYYVRLKNFSVAKNHFDEATSYLTKDNSFEDIYHYFIASYYIYTGDIPNSIAHCEKAISLFTKAQNYKRLINTNIIVANQYLKLKDYKKSLQINFSILDQANMNNHIYNQRVALNNIAFIYMMKNQFKQAIPYFEEMPKEFMHEKHYYAYMICLGEVDEFDKGKEVCVSGVKIAYTPYFKYMFKIYNNYFDDRNLKKLSRNIEKVFEKYDDYLDSFEKEFLCVLLGNQYKRSGNIKKALEYFEKLHELSYS